MCATKTWHLMGMVLWLSFAGCGGSGLQEDAWDTVPAGILLEHPSEPPPWESNSGRSDPLQGLFEFSWERWWFNQAPRVVMASLGTTASSLVDPLLEGSIPEEGAGHLPPCPGTLQDDEGQVPGWGFRDVLGLARSCRISFSDGNPLKEEWVLRRKKWPWILAIVLGTPPCHYWEMEEWVLSGRYPSGRGDALFGATWESELILSALAFVCPDPDRRQELVCLAIERLRSNPDHYPDLPPEFFGFLAHSRPLRPAAVVAEVLDLLGSIGVYRGGRGRILQTAAQIALDSHDPELAAQVLSFLIREIPPSGMPNDDVSCRRSIEAVGRLAVLAEDTPAWHQAARVLRERAGSGGDWASCGLAVIGLGRIAAAMPGEGQWAWEIRSFLLEKMESGPTYLRPWSALALGALVGSDPCRPCQEEAIASLRNRITREHDPYVLSGVLLAAGLARRPELLPDLVAVVQKERNEVAVAYGALAISLLRRSQAAGGGLPTPAHPSLAGADLRAIETLLLASFLEEGRGWSAPDGALADSIESGPPGLRILVRQLEMMAGSSMDRGAVRYAHHQGSRDSLSEVHPDGRVDRVLLHGAGTIRARWWIEATDLHDPFLPEEAPSRIVPRLACGFPSVWY